MGGDNKKTATGTAGMPHDGSVTLVCAACNTRYGVPVAEIPEGGRRVKCCRCGHVWFSELAAGGATRLPARSAAPETASRPGPAGEKAPSPDGSANQAAARLRPAPGERGLAWLHWLIGILAAVNVLLGLHVFADAVSSALPVLSQPLQWYEGLIGNVLSWFAGLGGGEG